VFHDHIGIIPDEDRCPPFGVLVLPQSLVVYNLSHQLGSHHSPPGIAEGACQVPKPGLNAPPGCYAMLAEAPAGRRGAPIAGRSGGPSPRRGRSRAPTPGGSGLSLPVGVRGTLGLCLGLGLGFGLGLGLGGRAACRGWGLSATPTVPPATPAAVVDLIDHKAGGSVVLLSLLGVVEGQQADPLGLLILPEDAVHVLGVQGDGQARPVLELLLPDTTHALQSHGVFPFPRLTGRE